MNFNRNSDANCWSKEQRNKNVSRYVNISQL